MTLPFSNLNWLQLDLNKAKNNKTGLSTRETTT
jgi:hypothetical protein